MVGQHSEQHRGRGDPRDDRYSGSGRRRSSSRSHHRARQRDTGPGHHKARDMERTPGHHRAVDRSRSRHGAPPGPLCPLCGITGHLARDCPTTASPATTPKSSPALHLPILLTPKPQRHRDVPPPPPRPHSAALVDHHKGASASWVRSGGHQAAPARFRARSPLAERPPNRFQAVRDTIAEVSDEDLRIY